MIIPFSYVLMWVSIFGNSAIDQVRSGDADFGRLAMNTPEQGFYTLLMDYPGFTFIASIATFVGILFYVTSADSGALVMANLSSHLRTAQDDGTAGVRIFWAVATGLLTIAMLSVGGITALQNATIIMGLPFAFVMILVMIGLYKALLVEGYRAESRQPSLHTALSGRSSAPEGSHHEQQWRQRLGRAMDFPDRARVDEYATDTARPALEAVALELGEQGVDASIQDDSDADGSARQVELVATLGAVSYTHLTLPTTPYV